MKFLCFGYMDEQKWDAMSKSEQQAMMQECFAYDDVLRKNGHFVAGEALRSGRTAKTLRWKGGKALVTDGPFSETKEQIGGLLVLEAKDMDHAVELMSRHPGVRLGAPSRFGRSRKSPRSTPASGHNDPVGILSQRQASEGRFPVLKGRTNPCPAK